MSRLSILFLAAVVLGGVIRVLQQVGIIVDRGTYSTAVVVGIVFVGMIAANVVADYYVERHRRTPHPRH